MDTEKWFFFLGKTKQKQIKSTVDMVIKNIFQLK